MCVVILKAILTTHSGRKTLIRFFENMSDDFQANMNVSLTCQCLTRRVNAN